MLCSPVQAPQYPTVNPKVCLPVFGCRTGTCGNATLAGIPSQLCRHLQVVLNASVRSVAGLRCSDHITATLANFHWLRASEHIQFKLATLVYWSLHSLAPRYLSDELRRVEDIPSRRNLRSASSCQLEVPRTRLTSVGDRTFSAAGVA